MDVARWLTRDLDVSGCADLGAVLDLVEAELRDGRVEAGRRPLIARVNLHGSTKAAPALADSEKLRVEMEIVAARFDVTLERVRARVTSPTPPQALDPELTAAIAAGSQELADAPASLAALVKSLDAEVGRALRAADLLDLADPGTLADLAGRAGEELVARLAGEGV
jgi:hypothetical protein